MRVDEIIDKIQPETKIAVRFDKEVKVDTAMAFICEYGGEEDIHCSEIEPDGYTDQNGISYLLLHVYDTTTVTEIDEELPFKIGEDDENS